MDPFFDDGDDDDDNRVAAAAEWRLNGNRLENICI